MRRIIVGVSGASGSIYGYTLLRALREHEDVETHLVLSRAAKRTIEPEMDEIRATDFEALADVVHREEDLAASISSASFQSDGMVDDDEVVEDIAPRDASTGSA
jgi:3-polyprenyl-4-hydroxybenzoate decarboxylase